MDKLRLSLSIWNDVLSGKEEIDGWSNNSVPQLAESISNLNNSLKAEEFLKEFEVNSTLIWELIDQNTRKLFLSFEVHSSFQDTYE